MLTLLNIYLILVSFSLTLFVPTQIHTLKHQYASTHIQTHVYTNKSKYVRFLNTVHFVKAFFDIYSDIFWCIIRIYSDIFWYIFLFEYISKKACTKCTVFKKRTCLHLCIFPNMYSYIYTYIIYINMLNIKTTRNYQKNFGKLESAVEDQKLHGRLSEYVVLTIQTVSAAFFV